MTCVSRGAMQHDALFASCCIADPGPSKGGVCTVPGLQRSMSGREDAPKLLMLRCARDTQLTHLFLDSALTRVFNALWPALGIPDPFN